MKAEVVVDGIGFGEGPVWLGGGLLACTSVPDGVVWRVDVAAATKEVLADTAGGPNGAALCSDGGLLVTQNGGLDYAAFGIFDEPPPYRPSTPGLLRIAPDGTVAYLLDDGFRAPNDLVVAPDGTVLFTDPGHYPPSDPPHGRVFSWHAERGLSLLGDGFWFCNGIGLEPDGGIVVVERLGLQRLHPDGGREWVVERLGRGGGDGFCVDVDGRFYVASSIEHGIRVVEDGREVDFLPIPGDGVTTNCCFGGDDGRTLFATDALPGAVVAWEGMPTPGLPLTPWPVAA